MYRLVFIASCALCVGCSALLGIEETSQNQPGGAVDANPAPADAPAPDAARSPPDAPPAPPLDGPPGPPPAGPATVITSASVSDGDTTSQSSASFQFDTNPPRAADVFECRLDSNDDSAFADCSSGFQARLLSGGVHNLEVRSIDAQGMPGPILRRSWTVEAVLRSIVDIQTGAVEPDTLVTLSNRRVTLFANNAPGGPAVFIQEGNSAPNRGIMTRPADAEPPMVPGLEVTVTGTYVEDNANSVIERATYIRGPVQPPYSSFFSNETDEIMVEGYEGVLVRVGGEIPPFNNCSGCRLSSGVCIHGCQGCSPLLSYVNLNAQSTFEFGVYTGVMVATGNNQYELWFTSSESAGDDICL